MVAFVLLWLLEFKQLLTNAGYSACHVTSARLSYANILKYAVLTLGAVTFGSRVSVM